MPNAPLTRWLLRTIAIATLLPLFTNAGELEDGLLASSLAREDIKGVEIAIERGANIKGLLRHPDAPSVQRTPIVLAMDGLIDRDDPKAPDRVERILRLLFSKGARLTGASDELFTPLARGHSQILKLLLENGANPHTRIHGYLPTELAIKYGQDQLFPILYERGAAKVPPERAAQIRFVHAASRQNLSAMLEAVSSGARVNQPDVAGKYALVQLVSMPLIEPIGYEALTWMLFEAKANVRVTESGDESTSTIHRIIQWNSYKEENFFTTADIVTILIEAGSDVSAQDYRGRTPLHYAADTGNYLAAEVLLRNSAKVATRDNMRRTPLDLAKSRKVIDVLRQYGAKE